MFPHIHESAGCWSDRPPASGHVALPSEVSQYRLDLDRPLPPDLSLIALPGSVERAVPRRQMQFRAGRYCATQAMLRLDPALAGRDIGRRADGVPVWPAGVVGSITHTDGVAAAAVASTSDVMAIGIDAEQIMSEAQARSIGQRIAWPAELACGRAAGLTRLEALTLVFSAKESIFKCLYPIVGQRFDFHDVRIVDIDAETFTGRLARTLSDRMPVHTTLRGRFARESSGIHTGVVLTANGSEL